ncbi:MAG TPA: TonB-dependent receptor, partial [Steroidobacteraceae bacterium]|nr:TonB-dependent receptor [Steroidobacteraceae bacterium]
MPKKIARARARLAGGAHRTWLTRGPCAAAGLLAAAALGPQPAFAQAQIQARAQTQAQAQTQAPSPSNLEEVVVTARKRDESFRDVPITVNVFTAQQIQSAGIERPADFIALVPNMTLVETQNAGNAFVVLRGISQARNSEPSVAVLVDGVLETNPAEFNQQLFDIQQIEVLKGPQGALYGRNAIGGAIIIRTKPPSDELEGTVKAAWDNGPGERLQGALSGPVGGSRTLKFSVAGSYYNTEGYIPNTFLHQDADPLRDLSGRARLLWTPNDTFTADLRAGASRLRTQALYFVIPRSDEANPFSTFTTPPNANDTTTPITVNNRGENNRDLYTGSLKLDFKLGGGTLTSVSAYDKTREILTGDAFDFRPRDTAIFKFVQGILTDLNQSQFLDVESYSQEIRFASPSEGRVRWIAGAYYVHTDRFISTGNMVDTGAGVFPVYRTPSTNPLNPQATFLADSQKQNAWALFGDVTFELTDRFELDAALRYDEDTRKNTTETPPFFLAQTLDPNAFTGQVRKHTWNEAQPKATLRYKPSEDITLYGGWSRGFRSGGFNQTGVGAVAAASVPPIFGVSDLFEAEVADTWEVGAKGQLFDRRLSAGLSLYRTKSENSYFFVFLAANSTQNLGNIPEVIYKGAELELNGRITDNWTGYASYGYTDSEITVAPAGSDFKGNQAPLVSRSTLNVGTEYRQPLRTGLTGVLRIDFQEIGRTWWDPANSTSRDPVDLLDLRLGLEGESWSVTAWSKNLTNEKYNAEF